MRPDNRISGEKIIGKGRLPTDNRATIALTMAASTLRKSDTYLGAQVSSTQNQAIIGAPCAIKAMAAKLARLIYRMLRYGLKYADKGAAFYHLQYRQLQITQLKWKAAQLGYTKSPESRQPEKEFLRSFRGASDLVISETRPRMTAIIRIRIFLNARRKYKTYQHLRRRRLPLIVTHLLA